jgi:hypothetical protein
VKRVKKYAAGCPALAADRVLIPLPRSGATAPGADGSTWTNLRLCERLVEAGMGKRALVALVRETGIPSAHWANGKAGRPTVQQHIDSMKVVAPVASLKKVTLIDDMLTCGTQQIAALEKLRAAGFQGEAMGFTVCQTYDAFLVKKDACVFEVTWHPEEPHGDRRLLP